MLNPLYRPRHRRRYSLDASLDGGLEECDVTLPPRSPLEGLSGKSLLGTRSHQVERGEGADAGGAEAKDLTPGGSGNTDGHVDGRRLSVQEICQFISGSDSEGLVVYEASTSCSTSKGTYTGYFNRLTGCNALLVVGSG
jgi:hypothetical protein